MMSLEVLNKRVEIDFFYFFFRKLIEVQLIIFKSGYVYDVIIIGGG